MTNGSGDDHLVPDARRALLRELAVMGGGGVVIAVVLAAVGQVGWMPWADRDGFWSDLPESLLVVGCAVIVGLLVVWSRLRRA